MGRGTAHSKNCAGLAQIVGKLIGLLGIFTQNVGPSLAVWANPVQFSCTAQWWLGHRLPAAGEAVPLALGPDFKPLPSERREKEIGRGLRGLTTATSGPLLTHLHTSNTIYMVHSECLPTRLNPLAVERTCFSQVGARPAAGRRRGGGGGGRLLAGRGAGQ